MEQQETMMDRKTLGKDMQKELKQMFKPLFSLAESKATDADFLVTAAKQLKLLPDEGMMGQFKAKYFPLVQQVLDEQVKEYKKHETAYLRSTKEKGTIIREVSNGWRVGPVLMETKPGEGKIRFCYNREPLTPFVTVAASKEIEELESQALLMLENASIDQEKLTFWMWTAYKKAVVGIYEQMEGQAVLIRDFAEEFLDLCAKDKEFIKSAGFGVNDKLPLWLFLYNLDRYRLMGSMAPAQQRIGLQTGSQQEVGKGLGVTVNGLHPEEEYKTMCYAIPYK
ncbi:hypothetical protein ABHN11_29750 [Brevibacillus centrosporus]|uniref:hypothetical protein n=1 Tax=Brevibacillus centrosporus TaxID=54910 RepID=UPI003D1D3ECE